MSAYVVRRAGLGPLHIGPAAGFTTICGRKLDGKVYTWRAGKQAIAIWAEWRHCPKCEKRDRELSRR